MTLKGIAELTLAVGVVLVATYEVILRAQRADTQRRGQWRDAVVSGLISVVFGVGAGFVIYGWQRTETERSERLRLQLGVSRELHEINLAQKTGKRASFDVDGSKYAVMIEYLHPDAFERAADSALLPPEHSTALDDLADDVRTYNQDVQFLFAVVASGASPQNADSLLYAIRNLQQTERALTGDVQRMRLLYPSTHVP